VLPPARVPQLREVDERVHRLTGFHISPVPGLVPTREIETFRDAEIRSWDLKAVATESYDITRYQPVLFAVASFEQLSSDLHAFFSSYDDEAGSRLLHHGRATPCPR
jgi:phenylalanine-4-hydroxylase